jgi:ketosteroid isomerase-like protein
MTETPAFDEISSRSATELARRYFALWNEPDADRRRRMIAELWTEDGRHILQPPQEIREIAARPGIALPAILEARGYEQIEARAASAYEHWVGSEGLSFRGRDDAERLGDVVKFHWEAVAKDGEVFAVGLNFLVLAADGRIERDYTFVVA